MKKKIWVLILLLSLSICRGEDLATKLQNISVTIHSDTHQGSGTIITRSGVNYVLTAGHVVKGSRHVTQIIKDGKQIWETKFDSIKIVKEIYVEGRSVGETSVEGEVIVYSSSDYGEDLALIRLRSNISPDTATFSKDKLIPVGVELIHIGSLEGQEGSNSFTSGSVSQIGRVLKDKVYDQSSCPAFPGSSGGGMFLKSNGDYIGMLVRGAGETFNYYIPIRRMRAWSVIHKIEFIFDESINSDLTKIRLEDREPLEIPDPVELIIN